MSKGDLRILVVKMSSIGDVIHTLPAVNALRRHFPNAHITWLVEESAAAVVASHQAVDRVLVSKRKLWVKGLLGPSPLRNLRDMFRFMAELRDTRYDIIIDFQGLMKSAFMVRLSRGARKIGYDKTREYSYLALNEQVPPYDVDKHAVFRYLHLVEQLNVDAGAPAFNVSFGEAERQRVISLLREEGWIGQPIVAINPMAKWKTKLWPTKNFAQLADLLTRACRCFVVFTGSLADQEVVAAIVSETGYHCADFSGQTDLKELAALYKMSDCVIATDTGPMHLSAAVGTPVVALFGPTAPWRTGPFGEGHKIVRANESCSPCFEKRCDTVECMKNISPEEVLEAAMGILERSPKG
jgi:3-deoxy-D-manno-octulosonic-acid transferase/heptosyltransferase-1